ncbi:chromosomal replication initiator protein DnaA [Candidatus Woesebacteria bacterium]|nr:chromosomal replication initiator protein DnaA [Candidatus Woesebacteria bacterium]MCD8507005.1 chromosomal replication initiator protein DnaA [Candidatus Woesebacteria bacterium]MCD8546661.1 chromosomal replication initiator protein DnaA [Candidatus Woesebacteria bacterium]
MSTLQPDLVWADVLRSLSKSMSPSTFSTFVKPLSISSIEEVGEDRAIIRFQAASPYVAQQAEMRCYAQLKQAVDESTQKKCDLTFVSAAENAVPTSPEPEQPVASAAEPPFHQPQTQPQPSQANGPLADSIHNASFQSLNDKAPSNNFIPPTQTSAPRRPQSNTHSAPQNAAPSLFSMNQIKMPTVDRYKLAAQKAHLREDYNFDTFAVSGSNEMAYAAAQAVAQSPGSVYNPLFIWGGVGVGKTHLMQSIGNVILKANPDTPLTYCMGEEFLNEIISAIRNKKTIEFKEKYRQLKVLLIDDIQFIAGKDTAQEEFFHTFNAITRAGGQIIMTSDRPPHEIHPLEDRLRSRFEGGLTIDIQQPTFELRTAILLIKSQKMGLDLSMDLAQMVAAEVESTRKLEGVVFKIHSAHRFRNRPLDQNLIREVLGEESRPVIAKKKLKPSAIMRAVTSHFHISANTLRGNSRKKDYVTARHIAMFLMKKELDLPYTEIGNNFGGRDHSSVMHAVSKIEQRLEADAPLSQDVSAIRVSLSSL